MTGEIWMFKNRIFYRVVKKKKKKCLLNVTVVVLYQHLNLLCMSAGKSTDLNTTIAPSSFHCGCSLNPSVQLGLLKLSK